MFTPYVMYFIEFVEYFLMEIYSFKIVSCNF